MHSLIKTPEDIKKIQAGGALLHKILHATAAKAVAGVSTWELDQFAEKQIRGVGGRPAFLGYGPADNPFPATLCTSINEVVVHGIPSKTTILKDGDIVSLDIGMEYQGLYTDTALTVAVGQPTPAVHKLLRVTHQALAAGIQAAQPGNRIGDIAFAIQKHAQAAGLGIIRDLVGHGVGYGVHEDPQVPNYGKPGTGLVIKPGMVLAIEPMFTLGDYRVHYADDQWAVLTTDGSLAAHFEHTVAITQNGPQILT